MRCVSFPSSSPPLFASELPNGLISLAIVKGAASFSNFPEYTVKAAMFAAKPQVMQENTAYISRSATK
ncbi:MULTISPECIES: hypothetical protein [unclassified Pseudophaeobacter]|uniref:hypothetical protein n=1 Tax=unclassified Pseudophaeobacter TaxID=2637024 RepID=UPI0013C4A702|nr:hypothetical protein [Pseudophaeobacter sp. EL27]